MKTLDLPTELLNKCHVTDIILDTTGLKVYGEGQGRDLAMDAKTGKLVFTAVSEEHVHDTACLEKALEKTNRRKGKVLFDEIADSLRWCRLSRKYNKH